MPFHYTIIPPFAAFPVPKLLSALADRIDLAFISQSEQHMPDHITAHRWARGLQFGDPKLSKEPINRSPGSDLILLMSKVEYI